VAKVLRDRMIANWSFSEAELTDTPTNFGSGYPSDPVCQAWMNENWNPVFGFADVVRFSWAPTKKLLQAHTAAAVTFAADDHDDDGEQAGDESTRHQIRLGKKRQQEQMSAFLSGATKQKRLPYFEHKKLNSVMKLPL
jgi:ribonuclease H2 subunit A